MVALAKLSVEARASERFSASVDGALHRSDAEPIVVMTTDLSTTGFSIPAVLKVAPAEVLVIRLNGLSARTAKVIHADNHHIGCAFLTPLTDAELLTALDSPTPLPVSLDAPPADEPAFPEPHVQPWPRWARGWLALGLAGISWAAVIALLRLA